MADWDADDYVPPVPPSLAKASDKWAGEDEDSNIKANWDDEDEEEDDTDKKEASSTNTTATKKKKPVAKRIAEKEEKRKRELEEKLEKSKELSSEEKLAEKLRLRKIQEEADLRLAEEAFGDGKKSRIDFMYPIEAQEFDEFREALVLKIVSFKEEPVYASFVEQLVRDLCLGLEGEDVRKITSSLTVIANEKRKDKQKKKGGKSKPSLQQKDDIGLYDAYTGGDDEFGDFI